MDLAEHVGSKTGIGACNIQQVLVALPRQEYFVPFPHMTSRLLAHQLAEVREAVPRLNDVRWELYLDLLFDDRLSCSLC